MGGVYARRAKESLLRAVHKVVSAASVQMYIYKSSAQIGSSRIQHFIAFLNLRYRANLHYLAADFVAYEVKPLAYSLFEDKLCAFDYEFVHI